MRTGNRRLMREMNSKLVLGLLRSHDSMSQVEISGVSGLCPATITNIVKDLRERSLVEEVGAGESIRGKKPTLLRFNPEGRFVIGVEIYVHQLTIAMLDLSGNIKKRVETTCDAEHGQKAVFQKLSEQIDKLLKDLGKDKEDILGIGISFDGVVDHDSGTCIFSSHFDWRDVPITQLVEKECGLPAFLENDVRSMALGEHWHGAGEGVKNMVCIEVDTGIGAGVISEGRLSRGIHNMGGEIGHTPVIFEGPECPCGNRGCLEMFTSGPSILNKIKTALEDGRKSSISSNIFLMPERIAIGQVFKAAREGDQLSLDVINEAGRYMGMAIAGIINYSDPEMIVLTGYVVDEGKDMFLNIIRSTVQKSVVDSARRVIKIEKGILGENAALIGAGTLVYRDMFKLPLVHV